MPGIGIGFHVRAPRAFSPIPGPVNTVRPAITGTLEIGATLTLSTGTWEGVGVLLYARSWYRNGVPIVGETGETYVPTLGGRYEGRVAATDDLGTRTKTSLPVVIPDDVSADASLLDFSDPANSQYITLVL